MLKQFLKRERFQAEVIIGLKLLDPVESNSD